MAAAPAPPAAAVGGAGTAGPVPDDATRAMSDLSLDKAAAAPPPAGATGGAGAADQVQTYADRCKKQRTRDLAAAAPPPAGATGGAGTAGPPPAAKPDTVYLRIGHSDWLALERASEVLGKEAFPLLEMLHARASLKPLLPGDDIPGCKVLIVRSIKSGGSFPAPDDETADNLIPVETGTTVREAAAGRLTGPNVFIKIRLSEEAVPAPLPPPGHFPLAMLTSFAAPSSYDTFSSTLAAKRGTLVPPAALDAEHWWLKYSMVGDRAGLKAAPVPVELMHSSFVDALDAMRDEAGRDPDLRAKVAMAAANISAFPHKTCTESQLTEHLQMVLSSMLRLYIGAATKTSTPKTTHCSLLLRLEAKSRTWLALSIEGKLNEHPAMQNDVHVVLHAPFTDGMGRCFNTRDASGTLHVPVALLDHVPGQPCFMLNIYGGHLLELRVAAWAGPTLCSTVLAVAPMHSHSGPGHRQLVDLLYGLAVGLHALRSCYLDADAAMKINPDVAPLLVPHLHELIHRDVLARAVGTGKSLQLTGHVKPNVFRGLLREPPAAPSAAGATGSGEPTTRRVIVKVASSYNEDAHKTVAAAKRAPELHACVRIGDRFVVVMDELTDDAGWQRLNDCPLRGSVVDVLLTEYRRAFVDPASGQRLVHGDARGPNILVRCTPGATAITAADVMFIDFEYAGVEGSVQFPPTASAMAFWPVLDLLALECKCDWTTISLLGLNILQAHDEALIRASCMW